MKITWTKSRIIPKAQDVALCSAESDKQGIYRKRKGGEKRKHVKNAFESLCVASKISIERGAGIVTHILGFHRMFTIVDQPVAWYGSVIFPGFGAHEKIIMRFEHLDITG